MVALDHGHEVIGVLLGVISDSHDRTPVIRQAVALFNERKVSAVLHCGDFVAPFALLPFKDLKCPFYAVFGNNDGERDGLAKLFAANGWSLNDRPWSFELSGYNITMLHEPFSLKRFVAEGPQDLIVYGHTHEPLFEKNEKTMVVNPGEACGWVKGFCSVAVVDMAKRECAIESI
ncbi:MAG: metallophosphoesterase [Nitrospinae bacterium]|nr:metallophosphoesterase [Nitrospinota bacterium]